MYDKKGKDEEKTKNRMHFIFLTCIHMVCCRPTHVSEASTWYMCTCGVHGLLELEWGKGMSMWPLERKKPRGECEGLFKRALLIGSLCTHPHILPSSISPPLELDRHHSPLEALAVLM